MASIISGYEYDIFISYRQKDNKYDGWVTEFVDHLKRELEATFKEDVSIYFDENPHDGLLEIHNVDKSLENKLRSLIFIPIISQTYCDTNTFAWQNEFVAFNKMAGSDPLGKDIKLASGNVCSRIIPIKIHDLDTSDTEVLENEMGCRLRSIEFIYKSAGVNRPLKPDDNPDKNLNKTYYRDQINKVANTVKDLVYGIHPDPAKRASKSYQPSSPRESSEFQKEIITRGDTTGRKISGKTLILILSVMLLLIAIIIFLPRLIKKSGGEISSSEPVRKGIAVLPVANLTGKADLDYMADAIHDDLINKLGTVSGLNVRPRPSTLQFKNSTESTKQIAKKLNVNNMLIASVKGTEPAMRIEVNLIEAFPEDKILWTSSFDLNWDKIGVIYKEIISHVIDGTGIKLTSRESKSLAIVQKHNPELYRAYKQGVFYINRNTKEDFEKGLKLLNEAMAIDPADPLPYLGLALGYSNSGHMSPTQENTVKRAISYAEEALSLDSTLAEAHVVLGNKYLYNEWDFKKAEYHLKKALDLNPSTIEGHYHYGWYLTLIGKIDEAEAEMKKAVDIDPKDVTAQGYLAWMYIYFGKSDKALDESRKLLQLDANSSLAYYIMGSAYSEMGMHYEAIEMHKKGLSLSPGFEQGLAIAYSRAGQKEKALEIVKEMEKGKDNWWYAYALAEVYATMGEKEKAIDCLELAFKLHGDFVPWMGVDFFLKPIYNEPRFRDLVSKLNLPTK
jgi:tetratricopeptide (TPR) repeat protein